MRNLLLKLWKDECGALIGNEWVFAVTIIVLGSASGLLMMRNAAIRDLVEIGQAVEATSNTTAHDRIEATTGSGANEEVDGGF